MNKKIAVVAAILFLCLIAWTHSASAQRSSPLKQTWEYRVDMIPEKTLSSPDDPRQRASIQNLLSERGADGWELAGVGSVYYYFKRPK